MTVLVSAVLWNGEQPVEASIDHGRLIVQGAGYSAVVAVDQIGDLTLLETLPAIVTKLNGYAAGSKLRGRFSVADLGACEVFVDRDVPPFLAVRSASGTLIVNQSTADETRRLREDLLRATGR